MRRYQLYCLVTEAHVRHQLARSCYITVGVELATARLRVQPLNQYTKKPHLSIKRIENSTFSWLNFSPKVKEWNSIAQVVTVFKTNIPEYRTTTVPPTNYIANRCLPIQVRKMCPVMHKRQLSFSVQCDIEYAVQVAILNHLRPLFPLLSSQSQLFVPLGKPLA